MNYRRTIKYKEGSSVFRAINAELIHYLWLILTGSKGFKINWRQSLY